MSIKKKLLKIFNDLLENYGPQDWWPADTPFEMMIGSILTQNTNWKNVEKALNNLKAESILTAETILACKKEDLQEMIRPSGYFRQKSERLQILSRFLLHNDLENGDKGEISGDKLREMLLGLKGVGPETADSILLYAFQLPFFIIDAYTRRFVEKYEFCDADLRYEEMRAFFETNLPHEVKLYNEYHALIVRDGKKKV